MSRELETRRLGVLVGIAMLAGVSIGGGGCGPVTEARTAEASSADIASSDESAPRLPYYADAYFTAQWLEPGDSRLADWHRVGAFTLTDQSGAELTQDAVRGRIHVANFFFTSCGSVCPTMTGNLLRVQEAFESDDSVVMLSYSVMPKVDTVPVLESYARKYGIHESRWHLLTGDRKAIYRLARQAYFAEKGIGLDKSSNEFLHTENVVLVDRDGHLRGVYNATLPLEVERLIEDVRTLQRTG